MVLVEYSHLSSLHLFISFVRFTWQVNSRDSSSSSSFSSVSAPSFIARLLHHIETIVHDEDDDDDDEWEPSTSCWSSTVCHEIKTSRLMFRNTKQWKPWAEQNRPGTGARVPGPGQAVVRTGLLEQQLLSVKHLPRAWCHRKRHVWKNIEAKKAGIIIDEEK